jgi:hypothetical protein
MGFDRAEARVICGQLGYSLTSMPQLITICDHFVLHLIAVLAQ